MSDLDIPALQTAHKAAIAAGPERWARESDALLSKLTSQAAEIERLTVQTNRWAVRVAQAQNDRDKARNHVDALQARIDAALEIAGVRIRRALTGSESHAPERFDLVRHLARQRFWSDQTFGPGARALGVVDHIRKELTEIEAAPGDLTEWIDVVILAFDGAGRSGATPEQIVAELVAKQSRNEARVWPDWRSADPDRAIEHDRSAD